MPGSLPHTRTRVEQADTSHVRIRGKIEQKSARSGKPAEAPSAKTINMVFGIASRLRWESWLLAAFIVNLGLLSGAGLYESRIVVPQWLVTLPSGAAEWRATVAEEMNVGLRFWAFVSTGPLTLLTVINLWSALRTRATSVRYPWLATGIVTLAERFATFGFFIPTMLRLFDGQTQAEAVPLAELWISLNSVRHAVALLALFLAVYTFHRHASHSAVHQLR